MTVGAMRWIDRFAGIPLCWAAGLARRANPARTPSPAGAPILVMKFFGLGSVLLSSPLLDALRARFPESPILYLTFAANAEVLSMLPQPSVRLTIDSGSAWTFLWSARRALREIRRARPALVFDLEFFSKFSTLIGALSGAPVRIGFALPARWRRWNLTHPVPLDHGEHVTEVFLRQLRAAGEPSTPPVRVTMLRAASADAASLQRHLPPGDEATEWLAVNINAGPTSLERRWPAERFAHVTRELATQEPRRRFAFIGSTDEAPYVSRTLSAAPDLAGKAFNYAGLLSPGELLALFHRCSLLLTNDSGPMHLAATAGTPVVALFGPESPSLYGPLGTARVLYKALPCSPCLTVYNAKYFVCPYDARCMKEIGVQEVLTAVRDILRSGKPGEALRA